MSSNSPTSRSWHLSVDYRTNQLFQELLFKLVLLKFPNKIQSISNKFQNYFKPNHQSPVKNYPSCAKRTPLNFKICKSLFFKKELISCKFPRYFKVQNTQIVGEAKRFLKGSKLTRSNAKVNILCPKVKPSLKSKFFVFFFLFEHF